LVGVDSSEETKLSELLHSRCTSNQKIFNLSIFDHIIGHLPMVELVVVELNSQHLVQRKHADDEDWKKKGKRGFLDYESPGQTT
jgi:hypothetical protein